MGGESVTTIPRWLNLHHLTDGPAEEAAGRSRVGQSIDHRRVAIKALEFHADAIEEGVMSTGEADEEGCYALYFALSLGSRDHLRETGPFCLLPSMWWAYGS